jgi:hypothetical protein
MLPAMCRSHEYQAGRTGSERSTQSTSRFCVPRMWFIARLFDDRWRAISVGGATVPAVAVGHTVTTDPLL